LKLTDEIRLENDFKLMENEGVLCPMMECAGKMIVKSNPTKYYAECKKCGTITHTIQEWVEHRRRTSATIWQNTIMAFQKKKEE
jgi:hypothetical protein